MTDYPNPATTSPNSTWSSLARLLVGLVIGVVAGLVAAQLAPWQVIPMLVWDGTALTWAIAVWWRIARLDAVATGAHATRDDPRRATADAMVLAASLASLAAVVIGLIKAGSSHGGQRAVLVAAAVGTIVISWAAVHTLFTLRYAALYYQGPDGGIDFKEDNKPTYIDFAYVAFTIGMTYQVSDTDLQSKEIRHTALRHALLSYVFGTVIIAAAINVAAGLAK